MRRRLVCICSALILACTRPAVPDPKLAADARAIAPLVHGRLATEFVHSASHLPARPKQVLYLDDKRALTEKQYELLPADERAGLKRTELDWYESKWGSPLAYARALEVSGLERPRRIVDFGYGTMGHLEALAAMGIESTGIDVHPMLPVLYGNGTKSITLLAGRFPIDVRPSRRDYDLFLSKNVLKRGYIHPEREAPARQLIDLGVSDDAFLRAVREHLAPKGRVLIFNICPKQAAPDQPYIPWADGRSPFARDAWESAGFELLAFDQDDTQAVQAIARALHWDREGMDLDGMRTWFTLAQAN